MGAFAYALPSTPTTAADSGGGGGTLSGLAQLFSAVGTSVTNVYRAVSPPSIVPSTQVPGGLVFNPQTGQYQPAIQGVGVGGSSSLLLLAGVAVVAILLLRR